MCQCFLILEKIVSSIFISLVSCIDRVESDLLVVLLESSEVLPGLGELSLLHALPDVPVDESSLE